LFEPGKSGADTGLVERLDVDELDKGTLDDFANQNVGQSKQLVQSHFDVSLARSFEKHPVALAAIFGNDSFVEIAVTTLEVIGFSDLAGGDDDHVGELWVRIAPVLLVRLVNVAEYYVERV